MEAIVGQFQTPIDWNCRRGDSEVTMKPLLERVLAKREILKA